MDYHVPASWVLIVTAAIQILAGIGMRHFCFRGGQNLADAEPQAPEPGFPIVRQVRYGFSVQNTTARPVAGY